MPHVVGKGQGEGTRKMILIGLGANLPSPRHGPPKATLEAALRALEEAGLRLLRRSRWYRSAPLPASEQPAYVNGVAVVETELAPAPLLALLHDVEGRLGRMRTERWGPRVIDLDLLAYHDVVLEPARGPEAPVLPHPRLHERAFVLLPLAEVAPDWRHPVLGRSVAKLIAALPGDQTAEPLDDDGEPPL